jgi:ComF family protein
VRGIGVDGWLQRWLPPACQLCDAPGAPDALCAGCLADLPWIRSACRRCARPLSEPGECGRCLRRPPPWSAAVVPLAWTFPVDALVSRFKYAGGLQHGWLLGRLLAIACAGRRPDALLPVPLHSARLAERGFNQSAELARPVSRQLGVRVLHYACRRVRATPAQAGLPAAQRRRNLAGAFVASPEVSGLAIAIVDDVLTTGATATALAAALLAAGARDVELWAVARGGTAPRRAAA